MNNKIDSQNWAKDARSFIRRAGVCFNASDWHGVVQNAQLCIEHTAKAIIAYFAEPEWTYNPALQLDRMISENAVSLEKKGISISSLKKLVQYVEEAAPWHGLSSYGEEAQEGHIPASELCTQEIAEKLFKNAQEAFKALENFLNIMC